MSETKELSSGVEMDALVAEKVMGWAVVRLPDGGENLDDIIDAATKDGPAFVIYPDCGGMGERVNHGQIDGTTFRPSEFIDDAWLVVEKLRPSWWVSVLAGRVFQDVDEPRYECRVGRYGDSDPVILAFGTTAAEAICRGALATVEEA